jgi:hypothetical protein
MTSSPRFDAHAMRARVAEQVDGRWRAKRPLRGSEKVTTAAANAIRALLAELPDVAEAHAKVALEFVGTTKPEGPRFGKRGAVNRHWHTGMELFDAAMASWLLSGVTPRDMLVRGIDELDAARAVELKLSPGRWSNASLDHYMTIAVLAREDARALAMFARDGNRPMKALTPAKARSERNVAAVVARERSTADTAALHAAIDRLMRVYMPSWTYSAYYGRAVAWLLVRDDLDGTTRRPADVVSELRTLLSP